MRKEQRDHAQQGADILACLAHPTRLLIVCLLLKREHYVQELLKELGSTKGNLSQHLGVLSSKGLLRQRKVHNRVYYSIQDIRVRHLVARFKQLYCPALKIN